VYGHIHSISVYSRVCCDTTTHLHADKQRVTGLRAGDQQGMCGLRRRAKAAESSRRMPWRQGPTKDVAHCEKPRGAVCRRRTEDVRMGKPAWETPTHGDHTTVAGGTGGTETSQYPEEKRPFPE
jgi:hypothetical protein